MAKYGWKEGQGLGREEQGLSTCLQVEKTGKRAGKIINKDVEKEKQKTQYQVRYQLPPDPMLDAEAEEEDNITDMMKNPSKVVLLKVCYPLLCFLNNRYIPLAIDACMYV